MLAKGESLRTEILGSYYAHNPLKRSFVGWVAEIGVKLWSKFRPWWFGLGPSKSTGNKKCSKVLVFLTFGRDMRIWTNSGKEQKLAHILLFFSSSGVGININCLISITFSHSCSTFLGIRKQDEASQTTISIIISYL